LFFVVRSKYRNNNQQQLTDAFAHSLMRRFILWLKLGLIAPIAMIVFAILLLTQIPHYWDENSWPVILIKGLWWAQLIHALAGVVVCRELRLTAFIAGNLSVVISSFIGFVCWMAITGTKW
jgi:hypothetical protein